MSERPNGAVVVAAQPSQPMRGLGRHGLLNAAATFLPGLYTVAATGLILHSVGPAAYGAWAMAVVVLGWLSLLDLGLSQTVVRASARGMNGDADSVQDVLAAGWFYAWLGLFAVMLGVAFAALIPIVLDLHGDAAQAALIVTILLACDGAIVLATASWGGTLRGAGRFGDLFVASIVQVSVASVVLVTLLPTIGLPGAAIAQLAGRLANRLVVLFFIRKRVGWFRAVPARPGRRRLFGVVRFSAPIFLMQLGTQLGSGTDLLIVGAVAGAAAAGLYAAGAQLVRYAAFFIFPLLDVVFPRLSALHVTSPSVSRAVLVGSLMIGGVVGAVAFGTLALEAPIVLNLWAGQAAALSIATLVLYAMAYVIITPAHLVVLALIARGRHRLVAVVILGEAIVNLLLSIILAARLGPIGPAVSTLIVVAVDDIVIIPILAGRRLGVPVVRLLMPAFAGVALGSGILLAAQFHHGSTVVDLVIRSVLVAGSTVAAVLVILRWPVRASGTDVLVPPGTTGDPQSAAGAGVSSD